MKKPLVIFTLLVLAGLFFAFDLHHWLQLERIQSGMDQFARWQAEAPLTVALAFFAGYVLVTALSLPGAAIMTLLAGALFGLLWGTLIVSFASTLGASLAFMVARYLLRDAVQGRFAERLKTINRGIQSEGAFYLFTLRLVPLFPFFLINLLLGLTNMRLWTFYWVSQLGMLAGTVVYINAGTRLAELDSLSDIMAPGLILSFVLLGVFPLLAKKIVDQLKHRRVYRGWQKPARFDRNLIVIGAGAGGLVSAYIAAAVNAKVTLVEAEKMGGDCLNYGCVPSKALIKSASVAYQMRHAGQYGLVGQSSAIDFRQVMQRVQAIIARIEPHDSVARYTELGVDVVQGYARIVDPWTVLVHMADGSSQTLTARSMIIATGASPVVPDLPGLEHSNYLTSDTLWDAMAQRDAAPQRLLVLGGGPIGCELSQAFARLGSQVTQIERGDRLMSREDAEVSALVRQSLQEDGVTVLTGCEALCCEREGDQQFLVVMLDGKQQRLPFDDLLCAVGRAARLQGFGLEELGIDCDRTVTTNGFLQTRYPNIYAAGDVAGPYQFTHTAAHQAWYAAVNALFGQFKKFAVDYRVIPWTTFVDPEVARVGLNEQEAVHQGIAHEVTRYALDDLDRAITESRTRGFVKVLTAAGSDRILGVTIVGQHGGDLLAEFVLAMKHNLGLNKILATIHSYPTWAEANKFAAGEWKKAHAPKTVLQWLARYHQWRRG